MIHAVQQCVLAGRPELVSLDGAISRTMSAVEELNVNILCPLSFGAVYRVRVMAFEII